MKRLLLALAALLVMALALLVVPMLGGSRLEDRSKPPSLAFDAVMEKVADLDFPPGNIAVSAQGRVFLTLHPDGRPPQQVVELVGGRLEPFPDEAFQHDDGGLHFQSILSLRIDRQGRLWVLDFARFGRGTPRILAFDIATRRLLQQHEFPSGVAGLGSMLNDFQVDGRGRYVFIAETSPVLQRPGIVVYDSLENRSFRRLSGDPSVEAETLVIEAGGRRMMLPGGLLPLRIAVDSIALSRDGVWLYYGAVSGSAMYRIAVSDLLDSSLDEATLASRVQRFADKTLSDGLTSDDAGNVYLGDMEHSAIHRLRPDGSLETLLADPRLRWPDGFSFGPDGWLYVTCSALQDVLFRDDEQIRRHAPYQIWRFRPGPGAAPGH